MRKMVDLCSGRTGRLEVSQVHRGTGQSDRQQGERQQSGTPRPIICFNCGKKGHKSFECLDRKVH